MAKHSVLQYTTTKYPQIRCLVEPVSVSHYSRTVTTDLPTRLNSASPVTQRHFPVTLGPLETSIDYSERNYFDQHLGQSVCDRRVQDPKGSIQLELVTPFQVELARLRMQRLRLEEDRLLEMKRLEELERIRGPQPKWYELRTPNFHYEMRKNNELIRSESRWQDLLNYREDLQRSREFNKRLNLSF
ncbi:uncharacterized protein LOC121371890 isoform X2 [Gigantopelta aegis]|nr:uncharacterized protein LOC121371890 isoform X2 [Gigantopelta aegis]XP_041354049.1 uncharacterized protein LOC121371890 isoform X2 [Gigantopelta aegis]